MLLVRESFLLTTHDVTPSPQDLVYDVPPHPMPHPLFPSSTPNALPKLQLWQFKPYPTAIKQYKIGKVFMCLNINLKRNRATSIVIYIYYAFFSRYVFRSPWDLFKLKIRKYKYTVTIYYKIILILHWTYFRINPEMYLVRGHVNMMCFNLSVVLT